MTTKRVGEILFSDLDGDWQHYIKGIEARVDEQDATIAALVEALEWALKTIDREVIILPVRELSQIANARAALEAAKEGAR